MNANREGESRVKESKSEPVAAIRGAAAVGGTHASAERQRGCPGSGTTRSCAVVCCVSVKRKLRLPVVTTLLRITLHNPRHPVSRKPDPTQSPLLPGEACPSGRGLCLHCHSRGVSRGSSGFGSGTAQACALGAAN